jgi:hypothetical protein
MHFARVDHIAQIIGSLQPGQAIVKTNPGGRAVKIDCIDARLDRIGVNELRTYIPDVEFNRIDVEEEFIDNIKQHPFISVVERRAMLGWDERRYSNTVDRLVSKGVIEKVRINLGRGGQRVLYGLLVPQKTVPGIKHEFFVNLIIEKLANEGIVCRTEKVGPDIQIPSTRTAINVETGSSDVKGNIKKALQSSSRIIICSDNRKLIQALSAEIRDQNIRCALIQDVIDVYHSMQTDATDSVR